MKHLILTVSMLVMFVSCGSSKKKAEEVDNSQTIKKDYEVRDASSNVRPTWMAEPIEWAQTEARDTNKYRYFSFETEPKVNREIACNLAKANVKSDIAGEITTFISKSLGASEEGDANIDENNPNVQGLRSFVENTLAEKVQAMLTGTSVVKTYWEKRNYLQKLGAKKDFIGYTCAALVRIEHQTLQNSIDRAGRILDGKADDPATKENVKKAIDEAKEGFNKAMGVDSSIRG